MNVAAAFIPALWVFVIMLLALIVSITVTWDIAKSQSNAEIDRHIAARTDAAQYLHQALVRGANKTDAGYWISRAIELLVGASRYADGESPAIKEKE